MKNYASLGSVLAITSAAGAGPALAAPPALATIYSFQGGNDGASPTAGVVADKAGNLYGTTATGGLNIPGTQCTAGCGTFFELSPPAAGQTAWTKTIIDTIVQFPTGAPVVDPSTGGIFVLTSHGGNFDGYCQPLGCGTVAEYMPPTASQPYWNKVVLFEFDANSSGFDGYEPSGQLTRGPQGALYGTTAKGGFQVPYGYGAVFELHPPYPGNSGWLISLIWNFFNGPDDGTTPLQGVTVDAAGNVYGASSAGPASATCGGSIFKIVPSAFRYEAGTLTNLYHLAGGTIGCQITGVLREDSNGVFYGTSSDAGPQKAGQVFTLSPPANGSTAWTVADLHDFKLGNQGSHPDAGVIADTFGKLYGTTAGYSTINYPVRGASVFELAPPAASAAAWNWKTATGQSESNIVPSASGSIAWNWKKLATFDGSNGASPMSRLIIAPNGKLYGTTPTGGAYNQGTIFEVTR